MNLKAVKRLRINNRSVRIQYLLLGFLLLVLLLIILLLFWFFIPPSRSYVEKYFGDQILVLDYKVWNGRPYLLFTYKQPDSNTLFAPLERQGMSGNWGWSGVWYSLAFRDAPATLGIGYCTGDLGVLPPKCKTTDIFGRIHNKSITKLEFDTQKTHYVLPVSYPGFAFRLLEVGATVKNIIWKNTYEKILFKGRPNPCSAIDTREDIACAL